MKILFLPLLALVLLTGCLSQDEQKTQGVWTSFIYPDKTNMKRSMKYGEYETLDACTQASGKKLNELGLTQRGFIECGLNCSFNDGMKRLVCERMVKK